MRIAGLTLALGIGAFVAVVSAGCGSRTPLYDLTGVYGDGGFDGNEPEGAPPPSCGDGKCDGSETCQTCALDCGTCPGCGDGKCQEGESCFNCPQDCGVCATCGDGKCDMPQENCQNCDVDCGMCPGCPDGQCDNGKTCYSCPQDCGKCAGCGDGVCSSTETCASCPQDCGVCDFCGDGKCEAPYETCTNCVQDCGECQVISCSQELQCALKCINLMSTTNPLDVVCLGNCVADGCPSAGYMVNQVVDCLVGQVIGGGFGRDAGGGGACGGMININCLLNACMNQVAACLSQRCPPTQQQDGG